MKLSTSTLGCMDWDLPAVIERLREYGYDAVDFRGLHGGLRLWELAEFSTDRQTSAQRVRDAGLAVSAFSSSAGLVWTDDPGRDAARDELRRTVELCHVFVAPMIRVFGRLHKGLNRAQSLERARAELSAWLEITAGSGVQLAIETHDAWTNSDDMRALIAGTDPKQVGVIWDVKHPYWASRETPATTWEKLKDRIVNTHWKDVRRDHATGKERLCLCGEGVLPLADFVGLLQAGGYTGYYTLEWERQWHPYLPAPEIAFPQFVQFMRELV